MGRLACHFPNSGHTKESLEVVATDWYKEFSGMTCQSFIDTIDETLRIVRFFPTIKDIRAGAVEVARF